MWFNLTSFSWKTEDIALYCFLSNIFWKHFFVMLNVLHKENQFLRSSNMSEFLTTPSFLKYKIFHFFTFQWYWNVHPCTHIFNWITYFKWTMRLKRIIHSFIYEVFIESYEVPGIFFGLVCMKELNSTALTEASLKM